MHEYINIFGTMASVIIAISLTQKNIKRLRILNLLGAMAFAAYGYMLKAWPVMGLNGFICAIDILYLWEMTRKRDHFQILRIEHPLQSDYLQRFIAFYQEDILNFFPEFDRREIEQCTTLFVLRDMLPVSLVIFREKEGEDVEVVLDYAVPAYRDMKNALYFFKRASAISDFSGKTRFVTASGNKVHSRYLEKMGFTRIKEGEGYQKPI